MRVFIAGLGTETNTFAPILTGMNAFQEGGLYRGDASRSCDGLDGIVARTWRRLADDAAFSVREGLFARAQPSGPTIQAAYEDLRDEIVAGAVSEGGADIVLLHLHGAMVATACLDCEGDLLSALRRALPGAVIGAVLDPHCHLTPAMREAADALVLLKEYPHTDYQERAEDLFRICAQAAARTIRPVMSVFDCRMVGFYPTGEGPMAECVAHLRRLEKQPRVLSASIVHGFPWGDTPDTGAKVLVLTDGDADLGARLAQEAGDAFYRRRAALQPRYPGIEAALDEAAAASGRIVLADTADNAGGGAPSDNTALLAALLARPEIRPAAIGCFWDPQAVAFCADAGLGARFNLRLGGKCGPASGAPLDLPVTVKAICEDHSQTKLAGSRQRFGPSVWLESDGVDIVVTSLRSQTFAPDAFEGLGISLADARVIAVKSSRHFHANFKDLASKTIYVATPGALQMDFAAIPFERKSDLAYFPRVADPLSLKP